MAIEAKLAVKEKLISGEELEIRLGNLLYNFIEEHNLPLVYRDCEPVAAIIDLKLLEALLEKLDEIEDKEILSDPEIVRRLQEAKENHLAGKVISHADLMKKLGLESEL